MESKNEYVESKVRPTNAENKVMVASREGTGGMGRMGEGEQEN